MTSLHPKIIFTNLEQCSWTKMKVAQGHSTQGCFHWLCEACGDAALPNRTVVRRVKVFWEARDAIQDNLCTWRPHVENSTIQLLASLLDADRRWTVCELIAEVGVCHKSVLHILHDILSYRKLWTGTKGKVMIFLDETLAHSYEPNLKRQSNEWKHPGSPHPKKVCHTLHNVLWRWCSLWHMTLMG